MIHIISYSYPPDNVPAAHRPYYLARYFEGNGVPVAVHSAARIPGAGASAPLRQAKSDSSWGLRAKKKILAAVGFFLQPLIQVDKALPWAITSLPRLVVALVRDRLRTGERPIVWATAPLVSNLYLGAVAAKFAGADLHLDIRDAIDGINDRRAPVMTRWVMRRAKTLTTVTHTLASFISKSGFCPPAIVVFNGVSEESRLRSATGVAADTSWVEMAYAGALYGGERPYAAAMELLSTLSCALPSELRGIRLSIAGREDLSMLTGKYDHDRFQLRLLGELSKDEALTLASTSEINLLLVGGAPSHRCGIPLKTFDLLGVGRPILYFGPGDADAVNFLNQYGAGATHVIDSEQALCDGLKASLARWLLQVRRSTSRAVSEPSADSQSAHIARIILESK